MQKLHGEIYAAKPNAFAVWCRNITGFHGRNSRQDDFLIFMRTTLFNLRGDLLVDLRGDYRVGSRQRSACCGQTKFSQNSGQQSRRKSLTSHVFGSPAPVNGGAANRTTGAQRQTQFFGQP